MGKNRQINASDATTWLKCRRRAWYDLHPLPDVEPIVDPFADLIAQVGIEHERAILEQFESFVEADSIEHTNDLIAHREPLIFQPVLSDKAAGINGRPDFLKLEDDGQHRVIDAKLALNIKSHPEILIQLAVYAKLFPSVHRPTAILGDRSHFELNDEQLTAADSFLADMERLLSQQERPRASYSHSKCQECPYHTVCVPEFEQAKELTLIYGLDKRSVPHLTSIGITNYATLAASDAETLDDGPYFKGERKDRLIHQARAYLDDAITILSAPRLPVGTWVHFDVESDPIANVDDGIVYLWGFLLPDKTFEYLWAEPGKDNHRASWRTLLKMLAELRIQHPALIIAHYSHYEIQIVKSYAKRFGDDNHGTAKWLLGDNSPLFDLRNVMREHLVLPLKSYGLKSICKDPRLVNFQWTHEESGSQWSVVRYHDYLLASETSARDKIKKEILSYNEDDVRATDAMVDWLQSLVS